jgi:CheY-like chemotaxis protein
MSGNRIVLAIDDNPADSDIMREAMDWVGFNGVVVTVDNAPKAFSYLSRRPPYVNVPLPHLIVLDLKMPILSGFDVLRELKARPEWAAIPVIVLTSSRHPDDIAKAEQLGAWKFVTKPTSWDGYVQVARDMQESCGDAR